MGRLQPWLNTERPDATHAVLLAAALEAARAQGVGHLSVRLDGEDFANLHAFEAAGWRLVDVSLKMTRPISGEGSPPAPPRPALVRGWTLASAEPSDAAWIRRLASQGHAGMHLMNDPALPREKTRALLADWIGRCLDRLAWRIFTLRDSEGKGRGFAIYLRAPAFAKAMGRRPLILDFVVLDPVVRGHGVGAWFLHESLTQCTAEGDFDYCELRTSAHNLTAVACYEQLGFCCCAHDLQLSRASLNASAF